MIAYERNTVVRRYRSYRKISFKIFCKMKIIFIVYVTSRKKIDNSGNIVYIQGDAHKENFLKSIFDNVKSIDVIVDFMVWSTDEIFKDL